MAYIHCHSCGWQQDDFYSPDCYNPASYLLDWNEDLCGKNSDKIDQQFSSDPNFIKKNGEISTREVIAREYERFANKIRGMKWITIEQWESEPNKVCPKCKSENLDID